MKARPSEIVLTNARLVLPQEVVRGSICLRDGLIAQIDTGPAPRTGEDVAGDIVMPGLIDIHTDHFEQHIFPRYSVEWNATRAALASDSQIIGSGITTVFDSLTVGETFYESRRKAMLHPMLDALEATNEAGMLRAEHLVHLRCELIDEETPQLAESLSQRPLVRMMSAMMHLPGERQLRDPTPIVRETMTRTGQSEDEVRAELEGFVKEKKRIAARVRPKVADIAKRRALPLMSHDDTHVEDVEEAIAEGSVICEFPCTLEAARRARKGGMVIAAGAPNYVRGGSQSGNVAVKDLFAEDLVDVLASDYVPRSLLDAVFLLAGAARGGAEPGADGTALARAVHVATGAPAAVASLADRGAIAPGKRADILRVAPVAGFPVVREAYRAGRRVL